MIIIRETRLDQAAVSRIWRENRREWFQDSAADFAQVASCDSAAAALVAQWGLSCSARGERLLCLNAPEALIALIRIYHLDNLTEFRSNGQTEDPGQ